MLKDLWHYLRTSLLGRKPPEKPKVQIQFEITKPDSKHIPLPKKRKPPKPIQSQPPLKCPYCEHLFDKLSGSRRKCPQCKGDIIVRTDKKIKLLFSPEGADAFDAARRRRHNRNNLLREYLEWMDGEDFDRQKATLEREEARIFTDEEFGLLLLNKELETKQARDDLWAQRELYFKITRLHHRMKLDPYEPKAAFYRCDLLYQAEQFGYDSKVVIHTGCSCDDCGKVDGKVMTIREALVKMPLPVRGCEMIVSARYFGHG